MDFAGRSLSQIRDSTKAYIMRILPCFLALISGMLVNSANAEATVTPKLAIIHSDNNATSLTGMFLETGYFKEDLVNKQVIYTNLSLCFFTAQSVSVEKHGNKVLIKFDKVCMFMPAPLAPRHRSIDQRLTTASAVSISKSLRPEELVQVDDRLVSADKLAQALKQSPKSTSQQQDRKQ